jgi:leader peptidase (prepilin peptidase)/N-methyltransferase
MSFLVPLFVFILGLCVGSFLNVLIFRFGFSERSSSRSRCMACDQELAWHDLLPVVSFSLLSGRCRACGSALSVQYPLVELALGALFLLCVLFVPPVFSLWSVVAFIALLVFCAALVGVTVYDIRHTLVPMPFVWVLLASAAAASLSQSIYTRSFAPFLDSVLGGLALFGFFFAIFLLTRGRGMGSGDAYVAGSIGILLGFFRGIEAVMVGVWSGTLVALLLLLASSLSGKTGLFRGRARVTMKTELPLIPFLAFGVTVALFTAFSPIDALAPLTSFLGYL